MLTVLIGSVILSRVALTQALLNQALEALSLPGAGATVAEVTTQRLRLSDLTAGADGEVAARSLAVSFSLAGLLDGRIESLVLEGATLRLDLRQGAAPFGSLQPLVDRLTAPAPPDGDRGQPTSIPDFRIDAARILAETDWGPAELGVQGGFERRPERFQLTWSLASPFGDLAGEARAEGDPRNLASARLTLTGGPLAWPGEGLQLESLAGDIDLARGDRYPLAGDASLRLAGLSLAGTRFDAAELHLALDDAGGSLEGRLGSDDGSVDLALSGRLRDLAALPSFELDLTGKLTPEATLWALAPLPFRIRGGTAIEANAVGQLPPLPANAKALPAWLAEAELSGGVRLGLSDLTAPEIGAQLSADLDFAAVWAAGELRLATRKTNRVSLAGLEPGLLADLGVAPELADLLGARLELSLAGDGARPAAIVWRPEPSARGLLFDGSAALTGDALSAGLTGLIEADTRDGLALARLRIADFKVTARDAVLAGQRVARLEAVGAFEGAPDAFTSTSEVSATLAGVALGELSAAQLDVVLPLQLSRDGGGLALALTAPGRLTFADLQLAEQVTSAAAVTVRIEQAAATIDLGPEGAPSQVSQEAVLSLADSRFDLRVGDGPPRALTLRAPEIRIAGSWQAAGPARGEITLSGAGIGLPDQEVALDGLAAEVSLSEVVSAKFSVAALRHLGEPATWAPLGIAGEARMSDRRLDLSARALGPGDEPLAEVTATHDLTLGVGRMEAGLTPLAFQPGGLQPADLSPLLAALTKVSGRVTGTAGLAWDGADLTGTAEFSLADVGFTYGEVEVAGLDLDLALDGLTPPSSPPGQRLNITAVEAGTTLSDLEAQFRLPPEAPGQLLIEAARFDMAGGRFALRQSLIDLSAERQSTRLKVESLDLERLFETLGIAGLEGQGELTGDIPLTVQGNLVSIEGARLEAAAPGVLRFRNPTALATLSGQDANLDQMLRALENFHYDRLRVTGALDQAGNLNFLISLAGHNPDYQDGQPYEFNINLDHPLAPTFDILRQGQTILDDLLRRLLQMRR